MLSVSCAEKYKVWILFRRMTNYACKGDLLTFSDANTQQKKTAKWINVISPSSPNSVMIKCVFSASHIIWIMHDDSGEKAFKRDFILPWKGTYRILRHPLKALFVVRTKSPLKVNWLTEKRDSTNAWKSSFPYHFRHIKRLVRFYVGSFVRHVCTQINSHCKLTQMRRRIFTPQRKFQHFFLCRAFKLPRWLIARVRLPQRRKKPFCKNHQQNDTRQSRKRAVKNEQRRVKSSTRISQEWVNHNTHTAFHFFRVEKTGR